MSDLNTASAPLTPATAGPANQGGRCGGRHHRHRGGFCRGLFAGALLCGVVAGAACVGSSHAHGGMGGPGVPAAERERIFEAFLSSQGCERIKWRRRIGIGTGAQHCAEARRLSCLHRTRWRRRLLSDQSAGLKIAPTKGFVAPNRRKPCAPTISSILPVRISPCPQRFGEQQHRRQTDQHDGKARPGRLPKAFVLRQGVGSSRQSVEIEGPHRKRRR